ncbi:hypothetical protein M885DRAFT_437699, partial [Pelagophyceae sp. CCMP2097]
MPAATGKADDAEDDALRDEDEDEEEAPPQHETAGRRAPVDAAAAQLKLERTIFVGNLPKEASRKAVAKFFSAHGPVESVRLRSLPTAGAKVDEAGNQTLVRKVSAQSRHLTDAKRTANAYVVFETPEAANKAVSDANGTEYVHGDERFHLRVDAAAGSRDAEEHLRTAFVGNLPRATSEEHLRSFFAEHLDGDAGGHRAIRNVRVVRDRETHEAKGIAYVVFDSRARLVAALELDGQPY